MFSPWWISIMKKHNEKASLINYSFIAAIINLHPHHNNLSNTRWIIRISSMVPEVLTLTVATISFREILAKFVMVSIFHRIIAFYNFRLIWTDFVYFHLQLLFQTNGTRGRCQRISVNCVTHVGPIGNVMVDLKYLQNYVSKILSRIVLIGSDRYEIIMCRWERRAAN